MLKRELAQTATNLIELGPRNKRRKDEHASSDDVKMSDGLANGNTQVEGESREKVVQQGLELWHVIKDAVNKEDRVLSEEFMNKPPKRQYADYYQLIQQPICLDEIKKKLDSSAYDTFEHVKHDLELCFQNAKRYNQKESQIWKDAKHLLKLVGKEYARMVPTATEDEQVDVMDEGIDADGKKKTKVPNMSRLLKTRLTKLIEKADDSGRIISTEFMELPNKKLWPLYYKEIKRPQCIEMIFKHLKRKEYPTSAEFAADVELVFSNAMHFNQDGTQIWEDARVLRNYFKELMSDLPPPLALPQYSKPSGKIKIKVPQGSGSRSSPTVPPAQLPTSTSTHLRVPGGQSQATTTKAKSSPVLRPSTLPTNTAAPVATTSLRTASVPVQTQFIPTTSTTPQPQLQTQPISYMSATYSHHYPNASYQPPATSTSVSTPHPTNFIPTTQSQASQSPAPPAIRPAHPLKSVFLRTEPGGRPFKLDHQEGVRTWATRLGIGETAVSISDVRFLPVEEDDTYGSGGDEDDHDDQGEKDDEEDESAMEVEVPVRNGRRKKKARARTKGRAALTAKAKLKAKKSKAVLLPEDVQVKLNGSQTSAKEDTGGEWYVELPVGSHVLEVGAKGGMVWKIFAERVRE